MNNLLKPALRQYRHNDSDDFIFGYDIEEVNNTVEELLVRNKVLEDVVTECSDFGEFNAELVESYITHITGKFDGTMESLNRQAEGMRDEINRLKRQKEELIDCLSCIMDDVSVTGVVGVYVDEDDIVAWRK